MINTGKLAGRTVFITGGSRGIGKSIALKVARDGANVVIAAKTAQAHPKLPGTIYTAAKEIEAVGGKGLPCIVDVRNEAEVSTAVENAVKQFGGIDILINNASAISLTDTLSTEMKKYDLMNTVNTRGTFLVSKLCIPHLKNSSNPHIVNISPPLNLNPFWFKNHVAYTIAKYGMSMCVLGMAEEFKADNIAVNAVWPKTAIHTAAIEMLSGPDSKNISRKPEIMADAVYSLICKDSKSITGQFLTDEDILRGEGINNFSQYACNPGAEEGTWFLDLKNGNGTTGRGQSMHIPDATLTMDSKHFFEMFAGNVKPATAFMTGKLKIDGSLQKAMKLEKLMGNLKSKL
ncbi:hydroxysteroid dehydrogenase-like protein 2 isoform X3 [Venturia canescens]|uniref:hydroxysteroid dehydrogenase-like protein 2 isoform X3 n=1 Tax=Venturia canescens TaxID=32260 RepID=UPI001C9D19D6|nr:hydroxysteroid dehydrogenase-like protein 2 isoform X3 [Venturia canescens]